MIVGPWEPDLRPGRLVDPKRFRIVRKNYKGEPLVRIHKALDEWLAYPVTSAFPPLVANTLTGLVDTDLESLKGRVDGILELHQYSCIQGTFVDWKPWHIRAPDSSRHIYTRTVGSVPCALTARTFVIIFRHPRGVMEDGGDLAFTWTLHHDGTELAEGEAPTPEQAKLACDQAIVKAGLGAGLARLEAWAPRVQADLSQIEMRP